MYHTIIKRKVRQGFDNVSAKNYEARLSECLPNVRHEFAGNHALSGVRKDIPALRDWFERVGRLLPDFELEITNMVANGFPWNTEVIVQWTGRANLANGNQYLNHGVHFLVIRWGKVASFRVYLDSQETARILQCLGDYGIHEAIAAPIMS